MRKWSITKNQIKALFTSSAVFNIPGENPFRYFFALKESDDDICRSFST
jgi:hypothetical protein